MNAGQSSIVIVQYYISEKITKRRRIIGYTALEHPDINGSSNPGNTNRERLMKGGLPALAPRSMAVYRGLKMIGMPGDFNPR